MFDIRSLNHIFSITFFFILSFSLSLLSQLTQIFCIDKILIECNAFFFFTSIVSVSGTAIVLVLFETAASTFICHNICWMEV